MPHSSFPLRILKKPIHKPEDMHHTSDQVETKHNVVCITSVGHACKYLVRVYVCLCVLALKEHAHMADHGLVCACMRVCVCVCVCL